MYEIIIQHNNTAYNRKSIDYLQEKIFYSKDFSILLQNKYYQITVNFNLLKMYGVEYSELLLKTSIVINCCNGN